MTAISSLAGVPNHNAKCDPVPNGDSRQGTSLTVIIPVYNEARMIDTVIRNVLAAPYRKQVIVIDDGSTDETATILACWHGHPDVCLLRHCQNHGKGAAIRTGLACAVGEFTIVQDADCEYDPRDYPLLIEPLKNGTAQVAYGSRFLARNGDAAPQSLRVACATSFSTRWIFDVGVRLLNFAVRTIYGTKLTDEATCYKAFPTPLLQRLDLQCERFEFCPEVTAKVLRLGLKISEVPIHYSPRSSAEGKKLRWRDGWQALRTLWRWRRWTPSPPSKAQTLTPPAL